MQKLAAILLATVLSGCVTRSGPFVTSITQSGPAEFTVEKCFSEHNALLGTTYDGKCSSQTVFFGAK